MLRRHTCKLIVATAVVTAITAVAASNVHAEQIHFSGIHPISSAVEGDFCYIEVPHVHIYEPDEPAVLYRVHDGHYHFVGDPVVSGYDGPKYIYHGHHPITIDISIHIDMHLPETEYCYIDGPHYHAYAPPEEASFTVEDDVYWYMGTFPRVYFQHRKPLIRINALYAQLEYEPPVITVIPPPGYKAPVVTITTPEPVVEVEVPPGKVGVHADVEVNIPIPTVDVHIGVPGVVVIEKGRKKHRRHKRHRKHKKYKKYKKHKRWR